MKLWTSPDGKRFLLSTFALACSLVRLETSSRRDDTVHIAGYVLLSLLLLAMSVCAFLAHRADDKA